MTGQTGPLGGWIDNLTKHRSQSQSQEPVEAEDRQPTILLVLQRMASRIRLASSLPDLLSVLATHVCTALPADVGLVRVFNRAQGTLTIQGVHGITTEQFDQFKIRSTATDSFHELRPGALITLNPDRPLVLQHADALSAGEIEEMKGLGALQVLALPLYHRGHLLGRLDLLRLRNTPFTVEDGTIANLLATVIASAVNAPPAGSESDQIDPIVQAGFAFQQSIEPLVNVGEMIQNVVEAIRRIIDCDRCYGLLWNDSRQEFTPAAVSGLTPQQVNALKQLTLSPGFVPALSSVMTSIGPVVVPRASESNLLPGRIADLLGIESAVIMPLRGRDGRMIGVLILDCTTQECGFSDTDLAILDVITPTASMMVENAVLYEEVKRTTDRLALVNDIGIDLASLSDLASLFRQVRMHVGSVIDASRFCTGLLLEDDKTIEYRFSVGDEPEGRVVTQPLDGSPLTRVIRERCPMLLNSRDAADFSRWLPRDDETAPSQSLIAVPIVAGPRVIGVMSAQSEMPNAYSEHDLDLLETVGLQTGVAIENARLYEMVQEQGERRAYLLDQMLIRQEAERKTIADDIHNDTLQTLASCLYRIDLTSRRITQLSQEDTQTELKGIRDNLAENIDRLRQIIFQIRPSTLDILGLEPALREHAKYIEAEAGMSITIDIEIPARLSTEMETVIYRFAQEAIDNVRLRNSVRRVVIRIRQRNDTIIVTIADDGVHDLTHWPVEGGTAPISNVEVGLMMLKERAELAGGQIELASRPGGGSTLQIILPNRSDS